MSTKLYILPRLTTLPRMHAIWGHLLDRYEGMFTEVNDLDEYDSVSDRLESEILTNTIRAVLEFGGYEGEVVAYSNDYGESGYTMSLAEDVASGIFCDISSTGGEWDYLDTDIHYAIEELRVLLVSKLDYVRFFDVDGHLSILNVTAVKAFNPNNHAGDWVVQVDREMSGTGLPLRPTLSEFEPLMVYWQKEFGMLVGHADSAAAITNSSNYIGRLTEKYAGSGLTIPPKGMGNPYSSLSNKPLRYADRDGNAQLMLLETKLDACYAYYLKCMNDLVTRGNENDVKSNHRHWVRFYNLFEQYLACHCGNFTNKPAKSRYCHGLVIHGISSALWGV